MAYVVKSPLVIAQAVDGSYAYVYAGGLLPKLADGVAEGLIAEGHIEEVPDSASPEPEAAVDKQLAQLKKAELEALAAAEGIALDGATTNAEKVAAIEAARAAKDSKLAGSDGGSDV